MKVQILEPEQATAILQSQQQSRRLLLNLSLLGTKCAVQINSPNEEQDPGLYTLALGERYRPVNEDRPDE